MSEDRESQPASWFEHLAPPRGGFERLLAKREQRGGAARRFEIWLPGAAFATAMALLLVALRGPAIDVNEARRQLTGAGTTLRVMQGEPVRIEQRATVDGVHMYAVSRAP